MARRYAQRPSEIMRIEDPYLAYCFDEAIALRGIVSETASMGKNGSGGNLTFGPGGLTGGFSGVIGRY